MIFQDCHALKSSWLLGLNEKKGTTQVIRVVPFFIRN
jgi:hypothetical protein